MSRIRRIVFFVAFTLIVVLYAAIHTTFTIIQPSNDVFTVHEQDERIIKINNIMNSIPFRVLPIEQNILLRYMDREQVEHLQKQFGLNVRQDNERLIALATLDNLNDKIHELTSLHSDCLVLYSTSQSAGDSSVRTITHVFIFYNHRTIIQIVVMKPVSHYLLVEKINTADNPKLRSIETELFYGKDEQIFDQFHYDNFDKFHFLSELSTCKFMSCPLESKDYLKSTNQSEPSKEFLNKYSTSIKNMKTVMRHVRWQFWAVCGTLLGWYRQCSIVPYTTDADFATHSFNAKYNSIDGTNEAWLQNILRDSTIKIWYRWGHADENTEYTFWDDESGIKVDLFMLHNNGSHYLMPFHVEPMFMMSFYKLYDLCSIDLLGYKVLTSCQPESTIVEEYGRNWREPVKKYNYANDPKNVLPAKKYTYSLVQKKDLYGN